MEIQEALSKVQDAMTVKRVCGEPYEEDGVTVIPVAKIGGGGGAGGGEGDEGRKGKGFGLGYGLSASPAGAYVIKGDRVTWQPALDLNRVILGGQIVAVVLLLTIRAAIRAWSRAQRRQMT
jgi:uncharacterized spore protein YtfJ